MQGIRLPDRTALLSSLSGLLILFLAACQPIIPLAAGREYPLSHPGMSEGRLTANRLVVKGLDGNIYTMDPFGNNVVALTIDASTTVQYMQPTWSPTAEHLAWTRVTTDDENSLASLVVSDVYADKVELVVPFPPFYISWEPSGARLAYLSSWSSAGQPSMALRLVELTEPIQPATTLAEGQPFYFAWSPDGRNLLTHSQNERIDILSVAGSRTPLQRTSADFPAPLWFPSGDRLLYAVGEDPTHRLVISNLDGTENTDVTTFTSKISFTLSPDERYLAYGESPLSAISASFAPLFVVELETGVTRQLSEAPVIASFWSPDSQKLAFLETSRDGDDFHFQWRVWDGSSTIDFASFLPTRTFLERYLAFFDQYVQSMTIWSPDSSAFTYAAFGLPGSEQNTSDGDVIVGIWVQELDDEQPRYIGRGVYAAWSPR